MKKIAVVILVTLALILSVSLLYLGSGQHVATAEALSLSESKLSSQNNDYLAYLAESDVGLIVYQGAKVDSEAYAYLTATNYNVFISNFTYNIAFFNPDVASKIIADNPQISTWYLVGHSLGGTLAYEYALKDMADVVDGVIMLGSYPLKEVEIDPGFNTLAMYGENDGLIQDYDEKFEMFGGYATKLMVPGGNHAGFGDYGEQVGDMESTVSVEDQHQFIISEIRNFVEKK